MSALPAHRLAARPTTEALAARSANEDVALDPSPSQVDASTDTHRARLRALAPPASVALAHDYLLVMRGAERTFAAISDLYPEAPIHTLLYDRQGTDGRFHGRPIFTSSLQWLSPTQSSFRRLMPLYRHAVRQLRPPPCDIVLSSSSAFAHGVRAPRGALHICYCHTPFRYAWYEEALAMREVSPLLRQALRAELRSIRRWDVHASRRVDIYVANSQLSRERIKRCYGREASIIHPPVDTHRFIPGSPGERLLVVSELVSHKRLHIALEAARRARAPISVVGRGPDYAALSAAYPEAEFLGRVDDDSLAELYAGARAVLVPNMEEFGITAVEAQAAGRPVIAAAAGGALETVIDGRTGRLVALDDVDSFRRAIETIEELDFDPRTARANAERFSVAAFQRRIFALVQHSAQAAGAGYTDEAGKTQRTGGEARETERSAPADARYPIGALPVR